jgi:2-oxo-4-hydroxy-4-carboxy--5-ureidoimidazoline (OHCU) decarboxylase
LQSHFAGSEESDQLTQAQHTAFVNQSAGFLERSIWMAKKKAAAKKAPAKKKVAKKAPAKKKVAKKAPAKKKVAKKAPAKKKAAPKKTVTRSTVKKSVAKAKKSCGCKAKK